MNSRILTISHTDLQHVLRARLVQAVFVLVTLLIVPVAWGNIGQGLHVQSALYAVVELPEYFQPYLFILVAALTYGSVVGERETRTIRILISLSTTRRDIVVGKLLSRITALMLVLIPLLLFLAGIIVVMYGKLPILAFLLVAGLILIYGITWTVFIVGVSAALSTQYRVLSVVLTTYVLFSPLSQIWDRLVIPLVGLLLTGNLPKDSSLTPTTYWVPYVEAANPVYTLQSAGQWLTSLADSTTQVTATGPFLFSIGTLVLFGMVPIALGLRRFEHADLGRGPDRVPWREMISITHQLGRRKSIGSSVKGLSIGQNDQLKVIVWLRRVFHRFFDWQSNSGDLNKRMYSRWHDNRLVKSRVLTIAHNDLRRTLRNPIMWGVVIIVIATVVFTYWQVIGGLRGTVREDLAYLPYLFQRYGVIIAVAISLGAIDGEREAGTVQLLLGLSATRRDIVIGKLFSRVATCLLVFGPLLALLGGMIVIKPKLSPHYQANHQYGTLSADAFLVVAGLILLYGIVWTALSIGVSAALSSRYRVLATIFTTYLIFDVNGLWYSVIARLAAMLFTGSLSIPDIDAATNGTGPLWFVYFQRFNPTFSLVVTGDWLVSLVHSAEQISNIGPALFSLVTLVLIGLVPLVIGAWRFRCADLE